VVVCFRINISLQFSVREIIPRNEIFLNEHKLYKTTEVQDKLHLRIEKKTYEIKYLNTKTV